MHCCLYVEDILRLIAHELVAAGRNGTVSALARCCKYFEDPVLDVLWGMQCHLHLLLDTFPQDIWGCRGNVSAVTISFVLSVLTYSILKDIQETPDGTGMDSFSEVRSKDAEHQKLLRLPPPPFRNPLGSAAPCSWRSLTSKFENSSFEPHY